MPKATLTPEALALVYLRTLRGWTQKQLSEALGFSDVKLLSRYERGEKPLSREALERLIAPLGYPTEALDALVFVHRLIAPNPQQEAASPVALTLEEIRRVNDAALAAGLVVADKVREELAAKKRKDKAEAARSEAEELWTRLKTATRQEQRELVIILPAFQSWALAERLCQESVKMAANRPEQALELANLAVLIAERVRGEENWRAQLLGFCWAHVANARRVANDFAGADAAFSRAWDLWRVAGPRTASLLPEWRLLDLEASLRREQQRFPEALECLERAHIATKGDPMRSGRILLKKEHVLNEMGEAERALSTLAEAAPLIEASGDRYLLFVLRFKIVGLLCQLGQVTEAALLLPKVWEAAHGQAREVDLVRLVWLEARIAAGQGRKDEAMSALTQVQREFTTRGLPYDAARASLELAELWLEAGRTNEVRELAHTMTWIFTAHGIRREAIAALQLFQTAARQETATVDLARSVLAELLRTSRSAPPR